MTKITAIGTAVPAFKYSQEDLREFATKAHDLSQEEARKLRFLYNHSGIETRYSVLPDFSSGAGNLLRSEDGYSACVGTRMEVYAGEALRLSKKAAEQCLSDKCSPAEITHLITVSCTGMSAPGLDLQLAEEMNMSTALNRTSVNFMGCYAAVHALKIADAWCKSQPQAKVLIVCTELCTLHFQKDNTPDNLTASLLFGDGSAAVLLENAANVPGIALKGFYAETIRKGRKDMAWQITERGFLMTLSAYIPDILKENFAVAVDKALAAGNMDRGRVAHWCVHPGGKKILDTVARSLTTEPDRLSDSYEVLRNYGNMSSPAILFVLENIFKRNTPEKKGELIFGAAFGPGLTVETFTAVYD